MSVRIMALVWAKSKHCGTNLLMLMAIADFANDKGSAYPSVQTLATKCRMKTRNAHYILKYLAQSGELENRGGMGPHGTNRYCIQVAVLMSQPDAAPMQSTALGPASRCTKPLQATAHEPPINHQEPPVKQRLPSLPCPHEQIRTLYCSILAGLPSIKIWTTSRQDACEARWREMVEVKGWSSVDAGLEWFHKFFQTVFKSDFLMGRIERKPGHEGWRCDFDFLMVQEKFAAVIEGKYSNRAAA